MVFHIVWNFKQNIDLQHEIYNVFFWPTTPVFTSVYIYIRSLFYYSFYTKFGIFDALIKCETITEEIDIYIVTPLVGRCKTYYTNVRCGIRRSMYSSCKAKQLNMKL